MYPLAFSFIYSDNNLGKRVSRGGGGVVEMNAQKNVAVLAVGLVWEGDFVKILSILLP